MTLKEKELVWGWKLTKLDKKCNLRDFPGGAVVKNLPASAEDTRSFDPWSRKIPHAAEQLSPCTTTTEPACHNY